MRREAEWSEDALVIGLEQRVMQLGVVGAAGAIERLGQDEQAVVGLRGKLIRVLVVLLLVGGDELLADRILLADEPWRADHEALGRLAGDLCDFRRIEPVAAKHDDARRDAELPRLQNDTSAGLGERRDADRVHVQALDLGKRGGKVRIFGAEGLDGGDLVCRLLLEKKKEIKKRFD